MVGCEVLQIRGFIGVEAPKAILPGIRETEAKLN